MLPALPADEVVCSLFLPSVPFFAPADEVAFSLTFPSLAVPFVDDVAFSLVLPSTVVCALFFVNCL